MAETEQKPEIEPQNAEPQETEPKKRRTKKVSWHVLPASMAGGPHGVGDPNDKTLREVESTVLIPNMQKELIKQTYCKQMIVDFEDCARKNGLMMPFRCRPERDNLHDCMYKWVNDEELKQKCIQDYLDKRTKYRETGVGEHYKKKKTMML